MRDLYDLQGQFDPRWNIQEMVLRCSNSARLSEYNPPIPYLKSRGIRIEKLSNWDGLNDIMKLRLSIPDGCCEFFII